jgi:hypothetical protein
MKSFRFNLERALEWRRTQLTLAEARVAQQAAALAAIGQARAELDAMGHRADIAVRQLRPLEGGDLGALGAFRVAIRARGKGLDIEQAECQKELVARQAGLAEARRRCRLLERLRERRWAEWRAGLDREVEESASDSYLAQWARRRASSL